MEITNVVDREFRKLVLHAEKPTLVAFRASWCMPSQDLVPILDELAEEFGDRVQFVAVDEEGDTAAIRRRYGVDRLPVTMLFEEGRPADAIGGMTSRDALARMIKRRLAPVRTVDEFSFDAEVLQARVPVLVHFHAAWCEPSLALLPEVERVAEKYRGHAKVVRVEFGPETARLSAAWGVNRVPTLALFVDGRIDDRILGGLVGGTKTGGETRSCVGLTTSENIAGMIERVLL